jgi:SRSO17 transposase
VAAGHSVDPARWTAGLDELLDRVAGRFGRVEPRRRAKAFVLGLVADLPRKNCWTTAEHAGNASPDGMQHLLSRAVWDEDRVLDDVRAYVIDHLGDPEAVLVIDETGTSRRATRRLGCSASTPAPLAASRTPRWPCTWCMPERRAHHDRPCA